MLSTGTGPDEQTREAQKQKLDMGCDLKEERSLYGEKNSLPHTKTKYRWIKDLKREKKKKIYSEM